MSRRPPFHKSELLQADTLFVRLPMEHEVSGVNVCGYSQADRGRGVFRADNFKALNL